MTHMCRKQQPELAECHIYLLHNTALFGSADSLTLGLKRKQMRASLCQRILC
jgi:hypothetical protein